MSNDLRYPIGEYDPKPFSIPQKVEWLADIKFLPLQLESAVLNLDEKQLLTPYRDGGWTIQQLVHHVADSHINAYCRFKLGLTEENPTIKPYEEADWALLSDYRMPVEPSLRIIEGLHQRWVTMLETFTEDEWNRTFVHPASGATMQLKKALALYAWHSKHHLAHVTETVKTF